ncbi:glycosyl hydrolase family 18 protein [Vallitalea okinawensis]|uniref:glycosyl hydrolase family 18 protein n=1 Tax=Vallitalea okinawensis TaxID=2078660 RepID=UPI001479676D|nr:glycosyl hydrolase family 18 protein [Vallitalea okinawensis]
MTRYIATCMCLIYMLMSSTYFVSFASQKEVTKDFKVMGYFSESPFDDPIDESIEFEGLTHLIYAFLKPKEDGSFYEIKKPERLKELVEKSHEKGVKVIISVGGVRVNDQPLVTIFETLASTEQGRKNFVNGITEFVELYNLDGVEIDWEYPTNLSSDNYERLILTLDENLEKRGKTLSAAVAGAGSPDTKAESVEAITSKSLECFDWINVMAYDLYGGQHSPYWFSNVSIDYWASRGVPSNKIVLGIPLYARPSWKQYRHLVQMDPEYAYLDYVKGEKLDSYYNGLNTIAEKARLALNKAGGIMFFDINEDTHDETSAQKIALEMINRYDKNKLEELFIVVENKELLFSEEESLGKPFIDENNRTQVPVRKALETIGASVYYDSFNQTVTAKKDDIKVTFAIGENFIEVNDSKVEMDTIVILKEDRTYLPLRWIYESFGYQVTWHEGSNTVIVNQ